MDGLGLNSFEQIKPMQANDAEMIYTVQVKGRPICPSCGTYTMYWKAKKTVRTVIDRPKNNKRVILLILRQQYQCLECKKYFLVPMPDAEIAKRITRRAIAYILEEVKHSPLKVIAEKMGLSWETIRSICHEHMPKEECKALMLRNADASRRRKRKPRENKE